MSDELMMPEWLIHHLCGWPRRLWGGRGILLLKAYSDDSRGGEPPVAILAGWVATHAVWAEFSSRWDDILRMSPRVQYFKFTEAMNYGGEFLGISDERRNEKLLLLVNLIVEFNLVGIASIIPIDTFDRHFGNVETGAFKTPYPLLFVNVMRRLHDHFLGAGGELPKIDFIFDRQVEEEDDALLGWYEFRRSAPEELRPMIGSPPSFLDDKDALPLQAADLIAGWFRVQCSILRSDKPMPVPPWGSRGNDLQVLTWTLDDAVAENIKREICGRCF